MSDATTYSLVILIALLASLGAMTNSVPVLTMAASALAGLLALLQGHPPQK
jgi:hypothetical protein